VKGRGDVKAKHPICSCSFQTAAKNHRSNEIFFKELKNRSGCKIKTEYIWFIQFNSDLLTQEASKPMNALIRPNPFAGSSFYSNTKIRRPSKPNSVGAKEIRPWCWFQSNEVNYQIRDPCHKGTTYKKGISFGFGSLDERVENRHWLFSQIWNKKI